jgi:hypothetical protein
VTIFPNPIQPDPRSMQYRKAQRKREQEESRHDKLCISITKEDGMSSCWCKCRICWDIVANRCICTYCTCRAENLLPVYPSENVQSRE